MSRYYDRRGHEITFAEWADLFCKPDYQRVALTKLDGVEVSTVWLGLELGVIEGGAPIIFESMVFGGPLDQECDRYCTEAEARAGHAVMVVRVREADRK